MNKDKFVESLVNMGFTYQELFEKGILVVHNSQEISLQPAPAVGETAQENSVSSQGDGASPARAPARAPETSEEQDTFDFESALNEVRGQMDSLRQEIRTMIQKQNIKDSVRSEEKQLTVDDAITGLIGGK